MPNEEPLRRRKGSSLLSLRVIAHGGREKPWLEGGTLHILIGQEAERGQGAGLGSKTSTLPLLPIFSSMAPPPKGSVIIRYSMDGRGLWVDKHRNLWRYSGFHPHHSVYLPALNLVLPQCQKQNHQKKKKKAKTSNLAQPTKRTKTKGQESW